VVGKSSGDVVSDLRRHVTQVKIELKVTIYSEVIRVRSNVNRPPIRAPREQVAFVPIVFVGALAAIQSSATEYYNDS
jgi:hypothetical protein